MKHRSDDMRSKETGKVQQQKRVYEKPQLGRVTLFADQVMALCRSPLSCPLPDASRS